MKKKQDTENILSTKRLRDWKNTKQGKVCFLFFSLSNPKEEQMLLYTIVWK